MGFLPQIKSLYHMYTFMYTTYVFLLRKNHKEMFYNHLRKVRENKVGTELKAELEKMTLWIDEDPKLFTTDVLYNLLLSYRDIQVGSEER